MAFRFSTNLSASAWASRSHGTFPTACYRDLQHFAVELFSKRGARRRKSAYRCLFARKTNTAKTGYSQTHGPKIISVPRENVASRQLVRRESAHDANKRCESKMAKIGSPTERPTSKGGFCGNQEAAPQLVTNRERRNKSGPVAASVQVKFMELRPSMCRWPIGDPKHSETFRFCGSACLSGAMYCKVHTAKAHAPNRPRTSRTTNFLFQHPVRVA